MTKSRGKTDESGNCNSSASMPELYSARKIMSRGKNSEAAGARACDGLVSHSKGFESVSSKSWGTHEKF